MSYTWLQQAENSTNVVSASLTAPTITTSPGNSILVAAYINLTAGRPLGNWVVSDGTNVYNPYAVFSNTTVALTFTVAPTGTSGTLNATFTGATGLYEITFSDNEQRLATFTNGSAAVSWGSDAMGALTGSPTTAATYAVGTALALFQSSGISGGALSIKLTETGGSHVSGLYVAEIAGLLSSNPVLGYQGNFQAGSGGSGANVFTSAIGGTHVTISQSCLLWGFGVDTSANTVAAPTSAGTSPVAFTGHTNVWASAGTGHAIGMAEDALVSSSASATFGATGSTQFDNQITVAVALALGIPQPLIGQTTPPSGATNLGTVAGDMYWITAPAYASGIATALNVGIQSFGSATALLLGLYDRNGNLLASGTVASPVVGINTASISSTVITYGFNYSISVQATTNVGIPAIADNPTGVGPSHANQTPNTVPSVLNGAPFVDAHGLMTLYASGSLTPTGVGTPLGGPARTSWHWRSSGGTS